VNDVKGLKRSNGQEHPLCSLLQEETRIFSASKAGAHTESDCANCGTLQKRMEMMLASVLSFCSFYFFSLLRNI